MPDLEVTLVDVWWQALVEAASKVDSGVPRYRVIKISRRRLRELVLIFDGKQIRAIEQNPETKSRGAPMARAGRKVMQFTSEGRYVANVAEDRLTLYGKGAGERRGERA